MVIPELLPIYSVLIVWHYPSTLISTNLDTQTLKTQMYLNKNNASQSPRSSDGQSCSPRGPLLISGIYDSPSPSSTSPRGLSSRSGDGENNEQKSLRNGVTVHSYGSFQHDTRVQESSTFFNTTQPILQSSHTTQGEGDTGLIHAEGVTRRWEDILTAGRINATWWRESLLLTKSSLPLMVTFSLQYSLTIASILSVGNLGKNELAAVSLAGMTGSITGYAVFQGTIPYCTHGLLLTVGIRPSYISRYLVFTSLWWRAKDTRWITHAAHVLFPTGCCNTNFSCMVC